MKLVGLTGGIGMGKTACAGLLRERGVPVIDTDDLAREVVQPGQPALQEIAAAFGPEVLGPGGELNRRALAERVFADVAARLQLEGILHPRIRALWRDQAAALSRQGAPLAVVVIPLLFETGAEKELDRVLCVACSAETQWDRLRARGWSEGEIERRNRAQLPAEAKIARAHYVIWSEAGMDLHAAQLDRILDRIRQES